MAIRGTVLLSISGPAYIVHMFLENQQPIAYDAIKEKHYRHIAVFRLRNDQIGVIVSNKSF